MVCSSEVQQPQRPLQANKLPQRPSPTSVPLDGEEKVCQSGLSATHQAVATVEDIHQTRPSVPSLFRQMPISSGKLSTSAEFHPSPTQTTRTNEQ
jgi:hypothetical protein